MGNFFFVVLQSLLDLEIIVKGESPMYFIISMTRCRKCCSMSGFDGGKKKTPLPPLSPNYVYYLCCWMVHANPHLHLSFEPPICWMESLISEYTYRCPLSDPVYDHFFSNLFGLFWLSVKVCFCFLWYFEFLINLCNQNTQVATHNIKCIYECLFCSCFKM